jgi:hypothetical protein
VGEEGVRKLIGKEMTIEELIRTVYPEGIDGFRQVNVRRFKDLVKYKGKVVGVYAGNGMVLTAEEEGVCVVPVIDGMTFWRK